MARSWWNRGRKRDIESLLRSERPEAPRRLIDELVSQIGPARRERAGTPRRLAHAGALTAVVVGGLGAVGGLGYAATP